MSHMADTTEKREIVVNAYAKQSCLPVTSLEYVTIGQSELLLAGEGPYLKLFSGGGSLLACEEVLPFGCVHGIRPAPERICCSSREESSLLLVFGQKAVRLIKLLHSPYRLTPLPSVVIQALDWVLDVCWLSFTDSAHYSVSLVTAHNVVLVYCVEEGVAHTTSHCSETNCILYSAQLLCTEDLLTVISGTVFNQILLWTIDHPLVTSDPSINHPVRLTLSGHEGVILCVHMSADGRSLVSTSDDRTVRIWTLPCHWSTLQGVELRESCVLSGHSARVWAARHLQGGGAVSIGEDTTCRVWEGGMATRVVSGHKGRSIWSMALNKDNSKVATGGGDCSVRVFSLREDEEKEHWDTHLPSHNHLPRFVCLHGKTALCHTDHGVLYAAELNVGVTPVWREVLQDNEFTNYGVVSLSSPLLALGSLKGTIKLLSLDPQGNIIAKLQWTGHSGKVFSLTWCERDLLLSCGPNGHVVCWKCSQSAEGLTAIPLVTLELPHSKHRWVSTALHIANSVLILGDRKGSLHVYRVCLTSPDKDLVVPVISSYRAHGPHGVTCLKMRGDIVYSAGRNGLIRRYSLSSDCHLTELTNYKAVQGMDWIESIFFLEKDILVMGFQSTNLVVHSTEQNRPIVSINCGGGHRSYDICSKQQMLETRTVTTVYLRQSAVCFRTVNLDLYLSNPVIQSGFMGREALSLEVLRGNSTTGELLLAVGGEDCTVGLVVVTPHTRPTLLTTLTGHTSCVKALASSQGNCGTLLFSGGARAMLKAWIIPSGCSLDELGERVELCGEVLLHDKPSKRRLCSSEIQPECRVMSLSAFSYSPSYHYLAAGCSDGLIRQFLFDEKEGTFYPLFPSLSHHDRCILTTEILTHPPLLLSGATDGTVCVWRLETENQSSAEPLFEFKAHQSGVNDIIASVRECGVCVVSVGDDNALTVNHLSFTTLPRLSLSLFSQYYHTTAHSSTITGVDWAGSGLVATTSVDQRLSLWSLESLTLLTSFTHDVADPATIKTYTARADSCAVICGVGIQYFKLQAN